MAMMPLSLLDDKLQLQGSGDSRVTAVTRQKPSAMAARAADPIRDVAAQVGCHRVHVVRKNLQIPAKVACSSSLQLSSFSSLIRVPIRIS